MVDFHELTTTPACRHALAYLSQQPFISDFYLAGGTALALQPMPRLLTPIKWADVRAYCEAAARRLTHRLSGLEG